MLKYDFKRDENSKTFGEQESNWEDSTSFNCKAVWLINSELQIT